MLNKEFKSQRRHLSTQMNIQAEISDVFPLMCPVMEYEWLDDWECEIVHSVSGIAELGCVFTTYNEKDGGNDVWLISHFDIYKKIAFVRVNQWRTIHYTLDFTVEKNNVNIVWKQELTSLTSEGNLLLESIDQAQFSNQIAELNVALEHYLNCGSCLRLAS